MNLQAYSLDFQLFRPSPAVKKRDFWRVVARMLTSSHTSPDPTHRRNKLNFLGYFFPEPSGLLLAMPLPKIAMDPLTISAASGLRARMETLDLLANNLANAGTTGFKSDREFYSLYRVARGGRWRERQFQCDHRSSNREKLDGFFTGTAGTHRQQAGSGTFGQRILRRQRFFWTSLYAQRQFSAVGVRSARHCGRISVVDRGRKDHSIASR